MPEILFTRIENLSSHGTPDLLCYNKKGTFFTCKYAVAELKKSGLTRVIGSIFNPADFLHRMFGKKPNELRKLRKMKQDDEIRNLLASRFDREMLTVLLQVERIDSLRC